MAKMRFIEKISEAQKPQTKTIIVKSRAFVPLIVLCVLQTAFICYLLFIK